MTQLPIYVVVVATVTLFHFGNAASIPLEDDAQALRSLSGSRESFEDRSKRFASHYFTNLRAKHYDKAAMQRFLQNRFLGKRNSNLDISQEIPKTLPPFTSGYIALFVPMDDAVTSGIVETVDDSLIEK